MVNSTPERVQTLHNPHRFRNDKLWPQATTQSKLWHQLASRSNNTMHATRRSQSDGRDGMQHRLCERKQKLENLRCNEALSSLSLLLCKALLLLHNPTIARTTKRPRRDAAALKSSRAATAAAVPGSRGEPRGRHRQRECEPRGRRGTQPRGWLGRRGPSVTVHVPRSAPDKPRRPSDVLTNLVSAN